MSPELEKKLYFDGIALFNEHEFFEAHEVWEDIWHEAYGTKFEFYQGMIQCAVALEHYLRSNPRGVVSLYDSYRRHFKDVPDVFMGLNVKDFLARMRRTLAPVLDAQSPLQRGAIALDLSTTPKIELSYDPFESGEAERFNRPA
jgi:predicted metal-dependent hydrolase